MASDVFDAFLGAVAVRRNFFHIRFVASVSRTRSNAGKNSRGGFHVAVDYDFRCCLFKFRSWGCVGTCPIRGLLGLDLLQLLSSDRQQLCSSPRAAVGCVTQPDWLAFIHLTAFRQLQLLRRLQSTWSFTQTSLSQLCYTSTASSPQHPQHIFQLGHHVGQLADWLDGLHVCVRLLCRAVASVHQPQAAVTAVTACSRSCVRSL